jgi:hypothetical protein
MESSCSSGNQADDERLKEGRHFPSVQAGTAKLNYPAASSGVSESRIQESEEQPNDQVLSFSPEC